MDAGFTQEGIFKIIFSEFLVDVEKKTLILQVISILKSFQCCDEN